MALLTLVPSQEGYSFSDRPMVNSVDLQGGLSRVRRDLLQANGDATVQWRCNKARYEALRAFYRATTENGSVPFELDLIVDDPDLTRHTVNWMPGTFQLAEMDGATYVVTAELEVKTLTPDTVADLAIIALFDANGTADHLDGCP